MDKREDEQQGEKEPEGGSSVPEEEEFFAAVVRKPYSDEDIRRKIQEKKMILFTTTFYTSVDSTRFQLCLQMIGEADMCGMPVVIVDSSPNDDVYETLKRHHLDGSGITRLARQTFPGRKGAGLREAAQIACELPGVTSDTILCFQEPEKVMMPHCWQHCRDANADVIVMYRSPQFFEKTYPIEQYHSEMYGNLLLDQVAKDEMQKLGRPYLEEAIPLQQLPPEIVESSSETRIMSSPRVDWHFGPFAFQAKQVELWTKYSDGDMYDAQLVPIVHAFRKGLKVCSVFCNYQHPKEMKDEEQGNVVATLKRLQQLYDLDPRVIKAWTDDFYC
jgi:hypothetical protein